MNVLVHTTLPPESLEAIRKLSPSLEVTVIPQGIEPVPKDVLVKADVVYTECAPFGPADAPRVKWIQTDSASTRRIRSSPMMKTTIPFANASGAYSVAVAECAMALLLGVTRQLDAGARMKAAGAFPEDYLPFRGTNLYGKTMGIVGYGSIGRQIARITSAMGMKILAAKRDPKSHREEKTYVAPGTGDVEGAIPASWYGTDQIADMFRQCDVAMVTLPATPHTAKLVGAMQIAALPQGAVFVNVGRGEPVDEAALVDALQSGRLAGAGLDVFAEEPLPASSPLWKLNNVVMLPHVASYTDDQYTWAAKVLEENLRRHLAGESLVNVIDKELLY